MCMYENFLRPRGRIGVLTMLVFVVFPFGAYRALRIYLSYLSTCMLEGNISVLLAIRGIHALVSALSAADNKSILLFQFFFEKCYVNKYKKEAKIFETKK